MKELILWPEFKVDLKRGVAVLLTNILLHLFHLTNYGKYKLSQN